MRPISAPSSICLHGGSGLILDDPDYVPRRDQKRQSRVLISKDRKSYAVLSPTGAPMPGSMVQLQRLAAELVHELEAERGPTMEQIKAVKLATEDYGL
jgi:hypothetical protein